MSTQKQEKPETSTKERNDYEKNIPILAAYTGTCNKILELEKRLADLRSTEKDLLKANPWLSQVKGIARKHQKNSSKEEPVEKKVVSSKKRSKSGGEKLLVVEETIQMVSKK